LGVLFQRKIRNLYSDSESATANLLLGLPGIAGKSFHCPCGKSSETSWDICFDDGMTRLFVILFFFLIYSIYKAIQLVPSRPGPTHMTWKPHQFNIAIERNEILEN
jgi:hypothetical protein